MRKLVAILITRTWLERCVSARVYSRALDYLYKPGRDPEAKREERRRLREDL
jgi:hypothetical protein